LYERDGSVLLLGVGYDHNTSLHLADFRANYMHKWREENGSAMLVNGRRTWVTYYDEAIAADYFVALGAAFEQETNEVVIGQVAGATVRLMRQRPLVEFAIKWYRRSSPGDSINPKGNFSFIPVHHQ
jgi:aminoglycoside 3-N-acetyltransferase